MSKAVGKLKRRGGDAVTDATLHRNTQYSKPLFGHQVGHAPVSHTAGNPRAGQSYRVGVTPDGRVVHLYADGTRIVLPKATKKAASSTGGMLAPDSAAPSTGAFLADLQRQAVAAKLASKGRRRDSAQDADHLAALHAAAAAFGA